MVIYKILNKINGKIYIGQNKRNNPEYFGSGTIILNAIKKYGKENFEKEILEECNSKEHMDSAEIYWIAYYNSTDRDIGYNITKGGTGGDTISNHPERDKISKKISQSNSGRKPWNTGTKGLTKLSEEHKQKLIMLSTNRIFSDETKIKMSLSRKKWHENASEDQKQSMSEKLRISQTGKKMPARTEEQKQNHSQWMKENNPMKGSTHTDEAKEKMRLANLGKSKTTEHRKKLSDANKGNKPANMIKIEINGTIYESLTDASKKTGINMSTLRNRIKSKNHEGYKLYEEKIE